MQLRYQFRVYPTPGQQIELAKAFGCARVVFNDGLRLRQSARETGEKYVSDGELSRRVITEAKATPQRAWLAEVSAVVLQQALADLNTAYRNFFDSLSGKRKGRKVSRRGSGPARTTGRRSVSPRMPGSRSSTTAACGCRRSATWRCAGRGPCRATRRPWRSSKMLPGGTSPRSW
ncbi:helix-turn-helix domain-containing protein [Micromonospora haikouensis]|uniref:helix-turn-helix domain-containing protein n=1 Tax=Micromonospora haikouensis TaxID=686309 RepID=UPI0036849F4F